jgi:hypothetical protein
MGKSVMDVAVAWSSDLFVVALAVEFGDDDGLSSNHYGCLAFCGHRGWW